jgi:tellurite resistance-related uncharacterized protein
VLCLVAATTILTTVSTALVPYPRPDQTYFPTVVGGKWVYQSGNEEEVLLVTSVEDRNGIKVVTIGAEEEGGVHARGAVEVSRMGLFKVGSGPNGVADSVCLLRLPITSKDSWPVQLHIHSSNRVRTFPGISTSQGAVEVRTPAGTFTAIKVRTVWSFGCGTVEPDGPEVLTVYYAPGVGPVKRVHAGKEWVLKSFTPGKP